MGCVFLSGLLLISEPFPTTVTFVLYTAFLLAPSLLVFVFFLCVSDVFLFGRLFCYTLSLRAKAKAAVALSHGNERWPIAWARASRW